MVDLYSILRDAKEQLLNSASEDLNYSDIFVKGMMIAGGLTDEIENFSAKSFITKAGNLIGIKLDYIDPEDPSQGQAYTFTWSDGHEDHNVIKTIPVTSIGVGTPIFDKEDFQNVEMPDLIGLSLDELAQNCNNGANINFILSSIIEKVQENGAILKDEVYNVIDSYSLDSDDRLNLKSMFTDGTSSYNSRDVLNRVMALYNSYKSARVTEDNSALVLNDTRANVQGFCQVILDLDLLSTVTQGLATALLLIPSSITRVLGLLASFIGPLVSKVLTYNFNINYDENALHNILDAPLAIHTDNNDSGIHITYPMDIAAHNDGPMEVCNFKNIPLLYASFSRKYNNKDTIFRNMFLEMLYDPADFQNVFYDININTGWSTILTKSEFHYRLAMNIFKNDSPKLDVISNTISFYSNYRKANIIVFNLVALLFFFGIFCSSNTNYEEVIAYGNAGDLAASDDDDKFANSVAKLYYSFIKSTQDPEDSFAYNYLMPHCARVINYLQDMNDNTALKTISNSLNTLYLSFYNPVYGLWNSIYNVWYTHIDAIMARGYDLIANNIRSCAWKLPDYDRTSVITGLAVLGSVIAATTVIVFGVKAKLRKKAFKRRLTDAAKLNELKNQCQSNPTDANFDALYKATKAYNFKAKLFGWSQYDPVNNWFDSPSADSDSNPSGSTLAIQLNRIEKLIF